MQVIMAPEDIQKPVQECGPSPTLPSDHVLDSGAVSFPGVFDQHGCPLIIFPVEGQDRLLELSKAEVVDFIHYFYGLLNKKQEKQSLLSVVADLRHASPPTTRFITETLLLLEEHKRTVHSVYIIQPKKKDAVKFLLKLLVPSKSCTASFRNILLKEIPELWNYIDRSQLPASLGGYFLYCHISWVSFIKEIDAFVKEFLSVVQHLPSCISTLHGLSRLPLPSDLSELQHFCSTNEAKFLQLRRDLGLDELLKHCETLCEKLRHPDREPCYQAMAGTPFFTQTAFDMLQNHSRITAAVEKVELLWKQAFAKAHLQLQVLQLRNDALQALVRCAEDVNHTLEEILPVKFQTREYWALDLERRKENLHSAVDFILQTLRAVFSYHQYYSKASRWYDLVLKDRFLPELLSGVHGEQQNNLRTVPGWRQRLSTFLKKNPPPDMEELLHLSQLSAAIPDEDLQQTGRRLSQRCMILRKLLISSGPVSVDQLQLALQWQYELLHATHWNMNSESNEDKGSSEVKWSPSELNHVIHENQLKAENHLVTFLSPIAFDGNTQLETSGRKYDLENLQRSAGNSDLMRPAPEQPNIQKESISSISVGEHNEEFGSESAANFSTTGIQIIPKVEAESLNLEIKVKRSVAPPTNPWLSLPVDDLEKSYTVTITPKLTRRNNKALWEQSSQCSVTTVQESESEPITHVESSCTKPTKPQSLDLMLHGDGGSDDPELSPICKILSSTISDGGDQSICGTEGVPTLLWDSYDLHDEKPEADSMLDVSLLDWEVKEQENLKEVERILNNADGILEEEEHVLAQEAVLDALLREGNEKDLWPLWHSEKQLYEDSSEQTEAGILSFEDFLKPWGSDPLDEGVSAESMRESKAYSNSEDDFCFEEQLNRRLGLVNEMKNIHVLDQLIIEENLKIHELRGSKGGSNYRPSESTPLTSHLSVTNMEMEPFWLQLEREKREVEKLEKSSDQASESEDGAPESGRSFVMEDSKTDSGEDQQPTVFLSEGLGIGCNAAMRPCGKSGIKEKPSQSQGHDVGESDFELYFCDTRDSSFCDLKESSVVVKLPTISGKEVNESSPQNRQTFKLIPHDGDFDPGGKPIPLSVSEPETSSLPGNNTLIEQETAPTTKTFEPASSLPTQLDLKPDALGVLLEGMAVDCSKDFLSPNFKEHINNNNNNLLVHGFGKSFSEKTNADKEDSPMVPAGLLHTEAELQSVPQVGPSQPPEFDPGGIQELNDDFPDDIGRSDSVRISDRVADRMQPHLWEENAVEIADVKTPVVLDVGSGLMKAGFANQDLPSILFPTITGVPKYEEVMNGTMDRDLYIGHDAQQMRGVLTLKHPIQNGIICNWDDMEKIWSYTFKQLSVDPEDHPVLLTEAAMNPLENRQRMVEIMFERFGVPFAYIAMQPVLALYAAGRTTGVVFDSGQGASHCVPVFEGYGLPHAVQRFPLAGMDVTLQLKKLLQEQGVCMRTTAEDEIVREIKEKCCCVALNYEAELNSGRSCREKQYTMPDGQIITLGKERFRAPEILFKPEMIGRDHSGMHESIFKSILRSDIDLRRIFLGNIVLSGGNTLLPGLPERLQAEIRSLVPAHMRVTVCVTSPKDRDFLVWSGGAVLANLSTFSSAWISQGEYEEYGPQIVFRKCF